MRKDSRIILVRYLWKILPLIIVLYGFSYYQDGPEKAPVSTIGTIAVTGNAVTVPIRVIDFINIRGCNQQFLYDSTIALATSFTMAPGVAGTISANLDTPGFIAIGWFTSPGFSMPDESVLFNITFSKVSQGTSQVKWNTGFSNRSWVHGLYYKMDDIPLEDFYHHGEVTFQDDAPITIAPDISASPGSVVSIPIRVENFNTIGKVSLTLCFDDSKMKYQSFTNNSAFTGLMAENPEPGIVVIRGTSSSGLTLLENELLCTIHFDYMGGFSSLEWLDDGNACQYSGPGPAYNSLNDYPASIYYLNGSVSQGGAATVKLYLEGYYNADTGQMNKARDFDGIRFPDRFEGNITDLVTIRLHDAQDYGVVLENKERSLLQDGVVTFFVPESLGGKYYISIETRNHLRTVSAFPIEFGAKGVHFDFSLSAAQAYGGIMKELQAGVWGLFAGDIDQDGVIDQMDRDFINISYLSTKRGYLPADINGDGLIDLSDREMANDNFLRGVTLREPELQK